VTNNIRLTLALDALVIVICSLQLASMRADSIGAILHGIVAAMYLLVFVFRMFNLIINGNK